MPRGVPCVSNHTHMWNDLIQSNSNHLVFIGLCVREEKLLLAFLDDLQRRGSLLSVSSYLTFAVRIKCVVFDMDKTLVVQQLKSRLTELEQAMHSGGSLPMSRLGNAE